MAYVRKGDRSGRTNEEEGSEEISGVSGGKEETSLRESMFEGRKSSLGPTVTIQESMVLSDTSGSDPIGNTY